MTGTDECSIHTSVTASETRLWTSPTTSNAPVIINQTTKRWRVGGGTPIPNIVLTTSHTLRGDPYVKRKRGALNMSMPAYTMEG